MFNAFCDHCQKLVYTETADDEYWQICAECKQIVLDADAWVVCVKCKAPKKVKDHEWTSAAWAFVTLDCGHKKSLPVYIDINREVDRLVIYESMKNIDIQSKLRKKSFLSE